MLRSDSTRQDRNLLNRFRPIVFQGATTLAGANLGSSVSQSQGGESVSVVVGQDGVRYFRADISHADGPDKVR